MGLRFLADHCVSNYVVQTLTEEGHKVVRLRDVLPVASRDSAVIAKAQELDAILLSLSGDFADIVSYPPNTYKGIVSLQLKNHPEVIRDLLARFGAYVRIHPQEEHYRGKLFVVEVDRIRVRE